jgi:dynactin complex subunit
MLYVCQTRKQQNKKIQVMKTTNNIRRIASISLASAALLFTAIAPSAAISPKAEMRAMEAASATYHLDNLNSSIEASIRFVAAELSPAEELLNFETEAAFDRMNELTETIEESIRFTAPEVNVKDDAETFEVYQAMQSLEELNRQIENSIYFQAPAAE